MEGGASVAVEFLSVECDMIFEPECDLETDCHVDTQQEGDQGREDGSASPSSHAHSPLRPPQSHTPPTVSELFKRRSVGVYSRKDPTEHFVLIYDPTLHPPLAKGEEGSSSPEKERQEGEGKGQEVERGASRCHVCHKQFRTPGCLVVHGLTHIQPSSGPPPPCPVCAAALPSRAALQIHVRRHFSVQTYQCPGCHQRHLSRAQLVMHQHHHTTHKHLPSSTTTTTTTITTTTTTTTTTSAPQDTPRDHQAKAPPRKERTRTPETDLQCERCDATFSTRAALWTHRKSHRERRHRRRRRYECPECGSQFWRSSALKKHRRAEHDT